MSGRKKKIENKKEIKKGNKKSNNKKLKILYIVLIVLLFILMLLLELVLVNKLVRVDKFYEIKDRTENIKKSLDIDTEDHETIGWVRVQGTNIDYPLYGVLKQQFDYPIVSDSYLWSLSYDSKFHDTMIVYGHNVMNLGPSEIKQDSGFVRMEELMNFVHYEFAQDNKYIQLSIDGKNYLYKIFAVNFMEIDDLDSYPKGGLDAESKKKYLEQIKKTSIYDYYIDVSEEDNILSVVTCSRFFGNNINYDFIVTGKMVEGNEKPKNYKVSRNKNYEKIDEILKGEDYDE